jgi:hypothetical protein
MVEDAGTRLSSAGSPPVSLVPPTSCHNKACTSVLARSRDWSTSPACARESSRRTDIFVLVGSSLIAHGSRLVTI